MRRGESCKNEASGGCGGDGGERPVSEVAGLPLPGSWRLVPKANSQISRSFPILLDAERPESGNEEEALEDHHIKMD